MNTTGTILTDAAFASWIANEQKTNAAVTKDLPPYSYVYYPAPLRNAS